MALMNELVALFIVRGGWNSSTQLMGVTFFSLGNLDYYIFK